MPTTKQRINLSVTTDMNRVLQKLASRDHASVAAKTLELINTALEFEEDAVLVELVNGREKVKGKFVAHEAAWL